MKAFLLGVLPILCFPEKMDNRARCNTGEFNNHAITITVTCGVGCSMFCR